MKIYKIKFDADHYQSLLITDCEIQRSSLMALDGRSKEELWPNNLEAELDNGNAKQPDIYSIEAGNMFMTERVQELLLSRFLGDYEFLPVDLRNQKGVVVNPLGSVDCLDHDKTVWKYGIESGKKLYIENFVFNVNRIPNSTLFRVEGDEFSIYCADMEDGSYNFKSMIEDYSLTGLVFIEMS